MANGQIRARLSPARGSSACSSGCSPRAEVSPEEGHLGPAGPAPALSVRAVGLSEPVSPERSIVPGSGRRVAPLMDNTSRPDFLSRPDSLLFSSSLLSPPVIEREVWLRLRLGLIGSSEVEKAQGREGKRRRRRERSSITVIIALMFIAVPSSFALTLWKLVKLKIIKAIR